MIYRRPSKVSIWEMTRWPLFDTFIWGCHWLWDEWCILTPDGMNYHHDIWWWGLEVRLHVTVIYSLIFRQLMAASTRKGSNHENAHESGVKSVKCYHGGWKIRLILPISDTVSSHLNAQSYCETCFTLGDHKFENDPWSKQGDVRCPELSIYARGCSILLQNSCCRTQYPKRHHMSLNLLALLFLWQAELI